MSLSSPRLTLADLGDELGHRPVLASEVVYQGMVWDVRRDQVDLGAGGTVERDVIDHPGAVIVVALREGPGQGDGGGAGTRDVHGGDDGGAAQVFVIKQYRHPVGATEWELPAGLLDVHGERPWLAAARELAEEADLRAGQWDVLADYYASPGGMSEALRVYLARELSDVPESERHPREAEELGMPSGWLDLDDAVTAALTGRLNNVGAIVGVLAAAAARQRGWATLRPADEPWPQHPAFR